MNDGIANRSSTRGVAALLAMGSFLALGVGSRLAAHSDPSPDRLEGTWRVDVTTEDCATGAPLQQFKALLTFARGGTMSGTTSSPAFRPGQRTSDYGVWRQTDHHRYRVVSEAFILFDSPAAPPVPGFVRGVQRLRQAIEVEGDTFASDATVRFFDVNGAEVASGCATAVGGRMK
jgi:hypothetical protein